MKLFYMRSFSYSEIVHRVATLTAVALLSACQANGLAPPQAAAFQKSAAQGAFQHLTEYQVFALPTLGGNYANAAGINRRGWALGDANLASNTTEHATIWRDGVVTDLGTLGGLNSGIGYPAQVGGREFIAGNSETSSVDPLGENWGELFTCTPGGQTCKGYKHIVLGFRWQNGSMIALPTLGGNNAVALGGTNDR